MACTYTKSLSAHFTNGFESTQFHAEITDDPAISPKLLGINMSGDQIDIVFEEALSSSEVTELNRLIKLHIPVPVENYKNIMMTNINAQCSTTSYSRLTSIIFPGAESKCCIHMQTAADKGITSHWIKITNRDTRQVIVEKELKNNRTRITELGSVENTTDNPSIVPTKAASFEIHVKKVGGLPDAVVYIDAIQLEYT